MVAFLLSAFLRFLGIAALASLPATASAAISPRIERAVDAQLVTVSRYYPTHPIAWTAIRVVPDGQIDGYCGGVPAYGCNDGTDAWVADDAQLSRTVSHEMIELATGRQICDSVSWRWYRLDGVRVSEWVLPSGRPFRLPR